MLVTKVTTDWVWQSTPVILPVERLSQADFHGFEYNLVMGLGPAWSI